ncbi:hypothetical protein Gpo141_00007446 [Globisporangium polare]
MERDESSPLLLPTLVVALAVVLSLEILQRLLLARCVAVALMAVVWSSFLARELQVKAMLAAIIYHGASELVHEWKLNFPSFARKGKDRKVILWLLFLVRVFIWGATFAAATSVVDFDAAKMTTMTGTGTSFSLIARLKDALVRSATTIAVLAVYCELIEVLVLLYFADQEVPYQWRKRVLLWALSCCIGVCEASGVLTLVARTLLAKMSPLGLFGVLIAAMWLSIQLPWHRVPEFLDMVIPADRRYTSHLKQNKQKRPSMLFHGHSDVEVLTEVHGADDGHFDREPDQRVYRY